MENKSVVIKKETMGYECVPWHDTHTWKPEIWYPLPVGSMWTIPDKCTVIEGYDIFKLDPKAKRESGDIVPVLNFNELPSIPFRLAVAICEAHNGMSWCLEDK